MKLSDLKWWHWTLATIAVAAVIRVATGGPLPFMAPPPVATTTPATVAGRPVRAPNTGPSLADTVTDPGMTVERASGELQRLTVEASIANPGTGPGLVAASGALVRAVALALQKGVGEDSTAMLTLRLLVATNGVDRTGKTQTHLPLYALDFNIADLFALKADSTPAQALGLSTGIVFNGADAHKAARDWCSDAANFNAALAFCGRVKAAKGV